MNYKKKVLIMDRFHHESLLYLRQQSILEVQVSQEVESPLKCPQIKDANALILRSRTPITEELLREARSLQLIITATSGFDHIDLAATKKWGITVMHTPNANIESTAQLTLTLVLMCAHRIAAAQQALRKGDWDRRKFVGHELTHKQYGIIGLGRIGSRVAEIARCFGMQIAAYDPYCDEDQFTRTQAQRMSLEELLKSSDILSLHVPNTSETRSMINRSNLEYVQRGSILVNTSRGSVIEESDLVEALNQGFLSMVGLDVFAKEPLPLNSSLISHPRAILLPHIGANTEEAFYKASQIAAEKALIFFTDGSTSDTLPPRASWYGAVGFASQ